MIGAVAGVDAANSISSNAAADYKALVCVFLYGGNDANNVIIPVDSASYSLYSSQRTALAIPQANVLPITPRHRPTRSAAASACIPPSSNCRKCSPRATSPSWPTPAASPTRSRWRSTPPAPICRPQRTFSHADQQTQWQSSIPDQPFQTGWGGRLADMIGALNGNSQISMSVSRRRRELVSKSARPSRSMPSAPQVRSPSPAPPAARSTPAATRPSSKPAQPEPESNLFHAAFSNVHQLRRDGQQLAACRAYSDRHHGPRDQVPHHQPGQSAVDDRAG